MEDNERTQLDWRTYWEMVVRRRWLLLVVLFAAALAATAGADLWPVRYQSRAEILVERQDVPSQYVKPNVIVSTSEELANIKQRIESRARLENLIQRFDLYRKERDRYGDNQIVRQMRKSISVQPVGTGRGEELTAFYVDYTYTNPRIAQQVTSQLTSEFINDSLKSRTEASVATTNFLKTQLRYAQKNMEKQDTELQEYKSKYLGELPEQQQNNLEILNSLEAQLYSETNARDRANQQKIYLESLASAYRSLDPAPAIGDSAGQTSLAATTLASTDKAIAALRQKLVVLDAKYAGTYPDVARARQELVELEAKQRKELSSQKTRNHKGAGAPMPMAGGDPSGSNMAQIESRLKATKAEIQVHDEKVAELQHQIDEVQKRLQLTPLRQQELAQATQADENAHQEYESLLKKKVQSELASDLEMQAEGERLSLVNPANLPRRPASPNRVEIVLAGWAVGLALGVGLVAVKETADENLRSGVDAQELIKMPILAYLPILRTTEEERRRKWLRAAEACGVVLLAVLLVTLGVYVCRVG